MTLRDLVPGTCFTAPEHRGLYELLDLEGGVAFCRQVVNTNVNGAELRVFDAYLEVDPIDDDRPRGAARPLRVENRDDAAAGGPSTTSRRGRRGPGQSPSRRGIGPAPGGTEPTFEDLVEYTVAIIVALLGGVGIIGWTLEHGLGVMTVVGAVVTSLGIAALRELRKARTYERPGEARAL